MHFIEIYYSSFSGKTTYTKPKDLLFLEGQLRHTGINIYLETKAVIIFRWKKGLNETYLNFKKYDFIKDRAKIDELIFRENVKHPILDY